MSSTSVATPRKRSRNQLVPSVSIEVVTPEMAAEWLEQNINNRSFKPGHYRKLKSAVTDFGWTLTPDAIAFDVDGVLFNGQHRLTLQIELGETVSYIVARDMPKESWDDTDGGKKRTLEDKLQRRGEKNVAALCRVIRAVWQYQHTAALRENSGGIIPPDREYMEWFYSDDDRADLLRSSIHSWNALAISDSLAAAFWSIFAMAQDTENATQFFTLLREPFQLEPDNAIVALRRILERDVEARAKKSISKQVDPTIKNASYMIAFNKWLMDEPTVAIKWVPGGAKPQKFPQVIGFPFESNLKR